MYYTADTHSFIWYLIDSPQLSQKARTIFDSCDSGENTIIVSAIVLLECIDIFDKKKINFNFADLILKISQSDNFIFSEINWSLILEINKIKGLNDLHDRAIIATAKIFDTYLISKDKIISGYYKRTIW